MATAMNNARTTELPNEIWQRIFFFASKNTIATNDHVKLWISVRGVSRSWRAMITREYLDAYIKDPARCLIYWTAGGDWVPDIEAGMIHHFELEMTFDRFDKDTSGEEDKTRVVFRETKNTRCIPNAWPQKTKSAHKRKKIRAWREKIEAYLGPEPFGNGECDGSFEATTHVICIYGQVNDTVLPGLRYDTDRFEISFEWEPMLIAFMKETSELQQRTSELSDQVKDCITRPDPSPSEFLALLNSTKIKVNKARRNLRRERIQRHYGTLYDRRFHIDKKEEAAILKRLSNLHGKGADDQYDKVIAAWDEADDEYYGKDNEDNEDMHESGDDDEEEEEEEDTSDANIEDDTDSDVSMDEMIDLDDVDVGEEGDSDDSDDAMLASEDDEDEEEDNG